MSLMKQSLLLPKGYETKLNLKQTQVAIKQIKNFFEEDLAKNLNLTRVSAPICVKSDSGLNDNLNGVERPVSFTVKGDAESQAEIVHSLAKWKRLALYRYKFQVDEGLYTDMNAIRRDEDLDNIHSIYVDQWDWEKVIRKIDRTEDTLRNIVKSIYRVFKETEEYLYAIYPFLEKILPDDIYFITSQELEDMYPNLSPDERETEIAKAKKAVFIMKIGDLLKSGEKHGGRAPDYDDWQLNGDIIFWNPVLEMAFELSSMGIRVDEDSLLKQLKLSGCEERKNLPFHKLLLDKKLPYTIGGGIGQSRICMFFLRKAHIGEIQSSIWPEDMINKCAENGIDLL